MEFKEMLIEALKDEKILTDIENILNIKRKNAEQSIKIKENNNLKEMDSIQLKELEDNYKLKLKQFEERENALKLINNKLKNDISNFKNEFKDIRLAYSIYLGLHESIKGQLDGIFKGRDIEKFLYCGVQYKNIEALWEYMKILSVNGKNENLIQLNNIFKHLLNTYNQIYEKPLYEIQKVEIGETFDEDKFIRGYSSKINGNIQEVYVNGYINLNTNNIVKKSVVRV